MEAAAQSEDEEAAELLSARSLAEDEDEFPPPAHEYNDLDGLDEFSSNKGADAAAAEAEDLRDDDFDSAGPEENSACEGEVAPHLGMPEELTSSLADLDEDDEDVMVYPKGRPTMGTPQRPVFLSADTEAEENKEQVILTQEVRAVAQKTASKEEAVVSKKEVRPLAALQPPEQPTSPEVEPSELEESADHPEHECRPVEAADQEGVTVQGNEDSQEAAEQAVEERLEQTKEDVTKEVTQMFDAEEINEEDEAEKRLQLEQEIVAKEKEARERLAERMQLAEEIEINALREAEVTKKSAKDFWDLEDDRAPPPALISESVWVFKSRWGHRGRRYKPIREQILWRGIFDGPVQAAFIWDDLFYVAKRDGQLAVTDWGSPWEGGVEEWGPILEGDVQAVFIHMDTVYVVKDGLVASTPIGQDWDGRLEEWGSRIFTGNVQAAFVRGTRLYVIKDGLVASELWTRRDWDGSLDDWGDVFPRSMKTAFICPEDFLYVARDVEP